MNLESSLLNPTKDKQYNQWRKAYAAVSFSAIALTAIYMFSSTTQVALVENQMALLHSQEFTTNEKFLTPINTTGLTATQYPNDATVNTADKAIDQNFSPDGAYAMTEDVNTPSWWILDLGESKRVGKVLIVGQNNEISFALGVRVGDNEEDQS